jgi:hypothetical protein
MGSRTSRARHAKGDDMRSGAPTPEELETLLEDALMIRDRTAVAALFEDGAVLITGGQRPGHGTDEIARLALSTWDCDHAYIAGPRRVVQARDVALIVADHGINVARRSSDGSWRYAIALQPVDDGADWR